MTAQRILLQQRRVRFGHADIYEFPCCLGDNPGLSTGGAPIALAARHASHERVAMDAPGNQIPLEPPTICNYTQRIKEFQLSGKERKQRLLDRGYTLPQIQTAAVNVVRIQESRRQSALDKDTDDRSNSSNSSSKGKKQRLFRTLVNMAAGKKKKKCAPQHKGKAKTTKLLLSTKQQPARGSRRLMGLS